MTGRLLAIGDIHGCLRAFSTLLHVVKPAADDTLVLLGDYVDRGPDSRGVIDRVLELRRETRLVTLLGNHEEMMVEARQDAQGEHLWRHCGGEETLTSYAGPGGTPSLSHVPATHWKFLVNGCVDVYETNDAIFVHGGVDSDLPLAYQPRRLFRWRKLTVEPAPHESGKLVVCGHTKQTSGVPLDYGHVICIDTWAYGNGWLTCLDVGTGALWQANEAGAVREGTRGSPPVAVAPPPNPLDERLG